MLHRMGQTQDTAQNLLHIHLTGLIGQRGQNIGEGAVPTFFQCIDCNNVTNWAVTGHQIHVLQFVYISGTNGNLCSWNTGVYQFLPELFKGGAVLLAVGLCLEQRNRADVASGMAFFGLCQFFQLAAQINGICQNLTLVVAVIDDDRQLDHALSFQLNGVHIGNDIAFLLGGSSQIQYKTRVKVREHFQAQIGSGVMALVHDDQRGQLVNDLEQSGIIGVFNLLLRRTQNLGKLGKVAVFLVGFQTLLATAPERVVGQDHDGQLLRHRGGVEILSVQQLLLGIDLYTAPKVHVDFLTVGMLGILQCLDGLGQNGVRWHQPDHGLGLGHRQCIKHRANGIAGQEGLTTAGGDLKAEVRHTGHNVLVLAQGRGALFIPEKLERILIIVCLIHQLQVMG